MKKIRLQLIEFVRFWLGIIKFFSSGFTITYYPGKIWSVMRIWYKGRLVLDFSPLTQSCAAGEWYVSTQDEKGDITHLYLKSKENVIKNITKKPFQIDLEYKVATRNITRIDVLRARLIWEAGTSISELVHVLSQWNPLSLPSTQADWKMLDLAVEDDK